MTLISQNYSEVLELLMNKYGNTRSVIAAHIYELLIIKKIVTDKDLVGLRKLN